MADDTFKQQRRRIDGPSEQKVPFEQIEQRPDSVEMVGRMPPGLAQAIQENRAETQQTQQTQQFTAFRNGPDRSMVDQDFKTLIDGLRPTTSVYEEITLPSLGRFYNGTDGPRDGILHIRPMTGEEENILATQRFMRRGISIDKIFTKCVQEPIVPEKLLSEDRTFILIYLRGISFTTKYEVQIKCNECNHSFNYVIDLDDLPIIYCPDDYNEHNMVATLPTSKYRISYRLATGVDEVAVSEYREKRTKNFAGDVVDDTLVYKSSLLVQSIGNDQATVNDPGAIRALLNKLPINDSSYIRSLISKPPFGMDTSVPVECTMCNSEFNIDLPLGLSFFFPETYQPKN